jgi:hypothetical protein
LYGVERRHHGVVLFQVAEGEVAVELEVDWDRAMVLQ